MYVFSGLGQTQYRVGEGGGEAEWVPVTARSRCSDAWQALLQQHRQQPIAGLDCLSRDATRVYIELCTQVHDGGITQQDFIEQWGRYVQQQCGKQFCRTLYDDFVRANPDRAECLAPYERILIARCEDAHVRQTVTIDQSTRAIQDIVARACPPQQLPPIQPPDDAGPLPPPPVEEPPPLPPTSPPTTSPPPVIDDGPPVAQNGSTLRGWGPVVGFGLLVAVGVTAFRKRK